MGFVHLRPRGIGRSGWPWSLALRRRLLGGLCSALVTAPQVMPCLTGSSIGIEKFGMSLETGCERHSRIHSVVAVRGGGPRGCHFGRVAAYLGGGAVGDPPAECVGRASDLVSCECPCLLVVLPVLPTQPAESCLHHGVGRCTGRLDPQDEVRSCRLRLDCGYLGRTRSWNPDIGHRLDGYGILRCAGGRGVSRHLQILRTPECRRVRSMAGRYPSRPREPDWRVVMVEPRIPFGTENLTRWLRVGWSCSRLMRWGS